MGIPKRVSIGSCVYLVARRWFAARRRQQRRQLRQQQQRRRWWPGAALRRGWAPSAPTRRGGRRRRTCSGGTTSPPPLWAAATRPAPGRRSTCAPGTTISLSRTGRNHSNRWTRMEECLGPGPWFGKCKKTIHPQIWLKSSWKHLEYSNPQQFGLKYFYKKNILWMTSEWNRSEKCRTINWPAHLTWSLSSESGGYCYLGTGSGWSHLHPSSCRRSRRSGGPHCLPLRPATWRAVPQNPSSAAVEVSPWILSSWNLNNQHTGTWTLWVASISSQKWGLWPRRPLINIFFMRPSQRGIHFSSSNSSMVQPVQLFDFQRKTVQSFNRFFGESEFYIW